VGDDLIMDEPSNNQLSDNQKLWIFLFVCGISFLMVMGILFNHLTAVEYSKCLHDVGTTTYKVICENYNQSYKYFGGVK